MANAKEKVYILSETMRSSKGGFYIEGTDIEMDFPDEYPLPMTCEVIEDGGPVGLRVLPFCKTILVSEQIQQGFPRDYKFNQADRDKLTFKMGRLSLREQRDDQFIAYVERAYWLKGNEKKRVSATNKTVYELYDEDKILQGEIDELELAVKAQSAVIGMKESQLRELYKLSVGGNFNETVSIGLKHMRKHLLDIAAVNPGFISDGVRKGRDEVVVLLNNALEFGVVTLNVDGMVGYKTEASVEFDPWFEMTEAGGKQAKFERTVDFLLSDDGKAYTSALKDLVKKGELKLVS